MQCRKRGLNKAETVLVSGKEIAQFCRSVGLRQGQGGCPGRSWLGHSSPQWLFSGRDLSGCSGSGPAAAHPPWLELILPPVSPPSRIPASRCFGHGFSVAGGLCFSQLSPPGLRNSAIKRSQEGFFLSPVFSSHRQTNHIHLKLSMQETKVISFELSFEAC